MNSWSKSDSWFPNDNGLHTINNDHVSGTPMTKIGESDLDLMRRLYDAGPEHRKYLRQIFVSMDITAPLYWWKEFDTYKVGTVANSCSTMHKIAAKEFEFDDFSHEHLLDSWDNQKELITHENEYDNTSMDVMKFLIQALNVFRELYLETKDKKYWWQMIQLLPSSYNQKRTVTMNYENVVTIIKQRTGHKLDEWKTLIEELYKLPYIKEIME